MSVRKQAYRSLLNYSSGWEDYVIRMGEPRNPKTALQGKWMGKTSKQIKKPMCVDRSAAPAGRHRAQETGCCVRYLGITSARLQHSRVVHFIDHVPEMLSKIVPYCSVVHPSFVDLGLVYHIPRHEMCIRDRSRPQAVTLQCRVDAYYGLF